jgi:predicted nucleic acid-binding protein
MGLKKSSFKGKFFIDTAPLIYFIEGNKKYQEVLDRFFKSNQQGLSILYSSALTLTELLVHPMKLNREDLVQKYELILTQSQYFELIPLDVEVAKLASKLRVKYGLKTPDAIQIATSIQVGCDFFLTNDLGRRKVTEVKVIIMDNLHKLEK